MTLTASRANQNHVPSVLLLDDQGGKVMKVYENVEKSPTLRSEAHGHEPCVLCIRERCGCDGGVKDC